MQTVTIPSLLFSKDFIVRQDEVSTWYCGKSAGANCMSPHYPLYSCFMLWLSPASSSNCDHIKGNMYAYLFAHILAGVEQHHSLHEETLYYNIIIIVLSVINIHIDKNILCQTIMDFLSNYSTAFHSKKTEKMHSTLSAISYSNATPLQQTTNPKMGGNSSAWLFSEIYEKNFQWRFYEHSFCIR